MGTLHEDLCTFLIVSRSVRLEMKSVSDKRCTGNKNIFCVQNFFLKILPGMKYVENTVELGKPQMTIWLMRIACWIPKATNTH
jgi:hypothetical protein